jgi:hypothetical protein
MITRTTIYIDESLMNRVRSHVPPRGLSALINELLTERVQQWEQAELQARLREGYLATRAERREVNEDWQAIDGEGWPG